MGVAVVIPPQSTHSADEFSGNMAVGAAGAPRGTAIDGLVGLCPFGGEPSKPANALQSGE